MMRSIPGLALVLTSACATVRSTLGVTAGPEVRLDAQVASLRADIDALRLENDSLRVRAAALDSAVVAAELRLRVVSLELQRLKDIDFRPRAPRLP